MLCNNSDRHTNGLLIIRNNNLKHTQSAYMHISEDSICLLGKSSVKFLRKFKRMVFDSSVIVSNSESHSSFQNLPMLSATHLTDKA